MSLSLQITVFNGDDLTIRGTYPLLSYEIQMDALSNASSTFTLVEEQNNKYRRLCRNKKVKFSENYVLWSVDYC